LFSVIGGKMSEGINFADDMARAVVVVGLPYPNPQDPELKERMEYLNRSAAAGAGGRAAGPGLGAAGASSGAPARSVSAPPSGSNRGSEYYENLCMRAVNQSIGRSIRHKDDYSVIILLDARYAQARIKAKLPGWIGDRITDCSTWGPVVSNVAQFFRNKRGQGSGTGQTG
jgi:chromosome transmission fidelity protein 1